MRPEMPAGNERGLAELRRRILDLKRECSEKQRLVLLYRWRTVKAAEQREQLALVLDVQDASGRNIIRLVTKNIRNMLVHTFKLSCVTCAI